MKSLLTLFILSMCFISKAQIVKPIISFTHTGSFYVLGELFNTEPIYNPFIGLNSKVGINIEIKKRGNMIVYGVYQLCGVTINGMPYYRTFSYKNNAIGITLNYTFHSKERRFRPFCEMTFLTVLKSKRKPWYFNGNQIGISPVGSIYGKYPPFITVYASDFYHSTPFVGSLLAGCDIRLVQDLHLNVALGYGLRIIKTKNARWNEGEDVYQKLKSMPIKTHYFHMLDFQLGLNYTFSFKKKPKTVAP